MNGGSVEIIGGGPGGLYLALLLRRRSEGWRVTVHETTPPGDTFGFGVGFTATTLRRLAAADAESHAAIVDRAYDNPSACFAVASGVASLTFSGNVAIARADLLSLLCDRAMAAGAQLRIGSPVATEQFRGADVVVGADGAGSATRQAHAARVGERVVTGSGLYLWCGADIALPRSTFATARRGGGVFVAHAYPYAADRSTFLIETDANSWAVTGLERSAASVAPGQSDAHSLALLQEAFADTLGRARLIGNSTQWRRFRTVALERWHDGNVVWLGDAAHTAHYSVGSGTKMAMEDAIALANALTEELDPAHAFVRYERERRPAVARLQRLARRSQEWWESFPARCHLPAEQLALAFLTRNGNVELSDVRERDPTVSRGAALALGAADDTTEALFAAPLRRGALELPSRVLNRAAASQVRYLEVAAARDARPARKHADDSLIGTPLGVEGPSAWGPEGDAAIATACRFVDAGCDAVRAISSGGDPGRESTLVMLDLAERIRLETGALTIATCLPDLADDAAAALAGGRVDLVWFSGGGDPPRFAPSGAANPAALEDDRVRSRSSAEPRSTAP